MSDNENEVAAVDAGEDAGDDQADFIRPVSAGSALTGGDDDLALPDGADEGDAEADANEEADGEPDGAPDDGEPEPEAQPDAEPAGDAEPEAAAGGSRPPTAGSARASSATGSRPPTAGSARVGSAVGSRPATASSARAGSARASKAGEEAAAAPAAGGEGSEAVEHHPDVITDITHPDAAEAMAEVDAMAQEQAREVIRSRQGSAVGPRPKASPSPSQKGGEEAAAPEAGAAPEEEAAAPEEPAPEAAGDADAAPRPASAGNASVHSAAAAEPPPPPPPAAKPAHSDMPQQQSSSPGRAKSGPWLTGTYKLPKSGRIISGEELCDALERMTNAYIDKYTREKAGPNATKEIMPGAATVYNTKKLSQDEYDAMVTRLYKPKERGAADTDRIQLVTLKFGEDGSEHWQPVKQVSAEEQQSYMVQLYQRCLDNRKKTQEALAAKYLKPLGHPRK